MKLALAVLVGLLAVVAGSLVVGVVLWPLFRVAAAYSPALGPNGPIAVIVVALTGPFFGGVFGAYWPLRWFAEVDAALFRGILIGVVGTLTLIAGLVSAATLPKAASVLVVLVSFVQIASTILGLSVGLWIAREEVEL